jgi:signal transduction histidine kinase
MNLKPGTYTFHVIACNSDGVWNESGASLNFTILPAWYQTLWFRFTCVVIFAFLLWILYRLRLRQVDRQYSARLEERVGERTRIARELHDTLLQSLHGLLFQFQAARNMLPRKPEDAQETLDEAIAGTEQAIAESRDAIHDLRMQPTADQELADLLEATGEELIPAHEPPRKSPTFRVIVEGDPRSLSPMLQAEIYRIAREVLRNAAQHADATQIEAELRYDDHQLRLRIRDDGKGIAPEILRESGRPGHWGLPGVRERAQRIGADLRFWSEAGAGTEIELTVPATIAYDGPHNGPRIQHSNKERKL